MKKITNSAELKSAIAEKKILLKTQWKDLKEQSLITYEGHKPMNLILNSLQNMNSGSFHANKIFGAISGLLSGFITKKFAIGKSNNILRKILGTVLQFGVSSFVAQHADEMKTYGKIFIDVILGKKVKKTGIR
ncbi:MAG: hypothetical protein PHS59_04055 [Paludibacter sp.]|nr:hypothetical protein [Paludibacter sp.]